MYVLSCFSHVRLFAAIWTVACQASVHGIFQAILKWVAIYYSRGSSWYRDKTHMSYFSCIGRRILYHQHHHSSNYSSISQGYISVQFSLITQSCLTLCDPMDCSTQSLSITNFQSPPKLMSIESVMQSNHLILCRPLLLLPSIFPSLRVFSKTFSKT